MKLSKEQQIVELKKMNLEGVEISPQAKEIISRIDDFPVEHFKVWWKKNFGIVNGQHLHMYLSVGDGISGAKKVN